MKVRFECSLDGLAFFTTRIMAGRKSSAPGSLPRIAVVKTLAMDFEHLTTWSILAVGPYSADIFRRHVMDSCHISSSRASLLGCPMLLWYSCCRDLMSRCAASMNARDLSRRSRSRSCSTASGEDGKKTWWSFRKRKDSTDTLLESHWASVSESHSGDSRIWACSRSRKALMVVLASSKDDTPCRSIWSMKRSIIFTTSAADGCFSFSSSTW
mmetsp:Transcript_17511/g.51210  ORF Transcript_17511/g.51210 Transcript_17511/m.51210 type:complete len:212 (-) Transcript_17511:465-1100(-)